MVASGVIVEVGGLICHAAMVARELGIPAVVLKNATRLIPDGALVEIDADRGAVRILD
jgi:pyruvate,water dikinase